MYTVLDKCYLQTNGQIDRYIGRCRQAEGMREKIDTNKTHVHKWTGGYAIFCTVDLWNWLLN